MSTLQDPTHDEQQTTATGDGTVPSQRTSPEQTTGRARAIRWGVYAVAGVLVAGVGVLGVTRLTGQQQGADAPPAAAVDSNVALKNAPITLPPTAGGKKPLGATDVTRRPEWQQQAKQAVRGAVFAAQTYGTPGSFNIVRVVALLLAGEAGDPQDADAGDEDARDRVHAPADRPPPAARS